MIEFRGPAKRIEDLDLPRVGQMIGVGEDEIHAILDVESSGSGFDSKGRPKMLFEPHVFYRNLSGEKRDRAVREGIAYPQWRPGSYPADSYPRLMAAINIDETAALKSASWGLGQILGENYKLAGYDTVQQMVTDFVADEDNQLEAMIRFIKAKKLDDDLRNHEWASFARGYNGALYAAHGYHLKLKAAFERWQRIKDTPLGVPAPPDIPKPQPKPKPVPKPPAHPAAKPTVAIGILAALTAAGAFVQEHPFIVLGAVAGAIAIAVLIWRK